MFKNVMLWSQTIHLIQHLVRFEARSLTVSEVNANLCPIAPVEVSRKSILICNFYKSWNSYSLWLKIHILWKVLKIWPFLTSQWGMNRRTRSTETGVPLDTDKRPDQMPAKFMKTYALIFTDADADKLPQHTSLRCRATKQKT